MRFRHACWGSMNPRKKLFSEMPTRVVEIILKLVWDRLKDRENKSGQKGIFYNVMMDELLLYTQIMFDGHAGTDYLNVDIDGHTVEWSHQYGTRFTDGTISYAPLLYVSSMLNAY